jgi:hypothetical protein
MPFKNEDEAAPKPGASYRITRVEETTSKNRAGADVKGYIIHMGPMEPGLGTAEKWFGISRMTKEYKEEDSQEDRGKRFSGSWEEEERFVTVEPPEGEKSQEGTTPESPKVKPSPFSKGLNIFRKCQEGPNKGKPGPCPEGEGGQASPDEGFSAEDLGMEPAAPTKQSKKEEWKASKQELLGKLKDVPEDEWAYTIRKIMLDKAKHAGPVAVHGMSTPEDMRKFTVDGVDFEFSDDPSNETSDQAAETIVSILTKEFPPILLQASKRIVFTTQKNKDDPKWRVLYNNPKHVTTATGEGGTICSYAGRGLTPGLFSHESGHNLASQLWGTATPPPDSEYGAAQKEEGPVSPYGGNSPAEDFAEACGLFMTERQEFKQKFPKKYRAVGRILLRGKKSLPWGAFKKKGLDVASKKRVDEETPNGGAYAIVYYKDANGRPVDEEEATSVEIVEFDSDGGEVARTYGETGRGKKEE